MGHAKSPATVRIEEMFLWWGVVLAQRREGSRPRDPLFSEPRVLVDPTIKDSSDGCGTSSRRARTRALPMRALALDRSSVR